MMVWHTDQVPDVYLTALCTWREARGCSDEAIRGVLHVIRNRAITPSWWGKGYVGVILKPYQFASFNKNDPNAMKFPEADDPIFKKILVMTETIIAGQDQDLTGGAVLYHSMDVFPDWAAKSVQTAKLGPFTFYREGR
jgi:hypothetical protein